MNHKSRHYLTSNKADK